MSGEQCCQNPGLLTHCSPFAVEFKSSSTTLLSHLWTCLGGQKIHTFSNKDIIRLDADFEFELYHVHE